MDKIQLHPKSLHNPGVAAPRLGLGLALGSLSSQSHASRQGRTGSGWRRLIPSLAIALVLWGSGGGILAQAAVLDDWRYDPESGALALQLADGVKPRYFLMANPMRIVVDLPGTHLELADMQEFGGSVVERIRLAEFQPGTTRFVLEMAPGTVLQEQQVALKALGNGRWELQPLVVARPGGGEPMSSGAAIAPPPIAPLLPAAPPISLAPSGASQDGFVSMEETLVRQQQQPAEPIALPELAVAPVLPLDEFPLGGDVYGEELFPGDIALPAAPDVGQPGGGAIVAEPSLLTVNPGIQPVGELPRMPQPALGQQLGMAILGEARGAIAAAPSSPTPLVDPAALVEPLELQIDALQSPGIDLSVETVTAQPLSQSGLLGQAARPGAAALLRQARSLTVGAAVSLPLQDPAELVSLPPQSAARPLTAQPQAAPQAAPQASAPQLPVPQAAGASAAAQEVPFLVEFGQPVPDITVEFPAAFAPTMGR